MEIVFVLVIMGVLAAVILPTTKTDPLHEAATQLASHIRYTQHLAMSDDRYDKNRKDDDGNIIWYKERWQLVFSESKYTDDKYAYTIFSDTAGNSTGDASESEIAINPQNADQIMTGGYGDPQAIDIRDDGFRGMATLNIGKKYGITDVKLKGGCSQNRISFDHLGRPFTGKQSSMDTPYNSGGTQRLVTKDEGCKIILSHTSGDITVRITKETGFVCILKEGTDICQ